MRHVRGILGALVVFALVTGCGGAPAEPAAGGEVPGEDPALAQVARIDDHVDVTAGAGELRVTDLLQPVALGDLVRTDASGFAEVRYATGAITRLDVLTEFTVVELADGPGGSIVRTRMGVGRTWHRVRALTGDDTYEVETGVAVATVRGTAFTISCPTSTECTFTVYEGALAVRTAGTTVTLSAGQTLTVRAGEPVGEPTAAPPLADDAWLGRNVRLDEADVPGSTEEPAPPADGEVGALSLHVSPASGPVGTVVTATVSGCFTGDPAWEARLDFAYVGFTPANSEFFHPDAHGNAVVEIEVLAKDQPGNPGTDGEFNLMCGEDWVTVPFDVTEARRVGRG